MNELEKSQYETCQRNLEYYFTDDEKMQMSQQLAVETQNKRRLEDQKKAVTSQYGSQINEKLNQLTVCPTKLQQVMNTVILNVPFNGIHPLKQKLITRSDTGENFVENMTEYDHNLFNQYQEKLQEEADGESEVDADEIQTDEESESEAEPAEMDESETVY